MYNPIYKNVSLSLSSSIKHKKIEIALISFLKWNCIFVRQPNKPPTYEDKNTYVTPHAVSRSLYRTPTFFK